MMFSVTGTRKLPLAARLFVLAAVSLTLAACETDGTGPSAMDAPKAETVSAKTGAAAPKSETPRAQAARPAEPAANAEPMTHARAARECWMRTEKANPREDLDRRADVVNKCIDEKLKAAGAQAPNS